MATKNKKINQNKAFNMVSPNVGDQKLPEKNEGLKSSFLVNKNGMPVKSITSLSDKPNNNKVRNASPNLCCRSSFLSNVKSWNTNNNMPKLTIPRVVLGIAEFSIFSFPGNWKYKIGFLSAFNISFELSNGLSEIFFGGRKNMSELKPDCK